MTSRKTVMRLLALAPAPLLDALWQDPECGPFLERELLPAMQKAVEEKRAARVKRAAGTRVNFFTMVRGED